MDLNLVTRLPEQPEPSGAGLLAEMRAIAAQIPARRQVLVGEREYDRLIAAGARPELLTRCAFVPEDRVVVLDVDRIERECERRLAELRMGPL